MRDNFNFGSISRENSKMKVEEPTQTQIVDLPHEIVSQIAVRIPSIKDFTSFYQPTKRINTFANKTFDVEFALWMRVFTPRR